MRWWHSGPIRERLRFLTGVGLISLTLVTGGALGLRAAQKETSDSLEGLNSDSEEKVKLYQLLYDQQVTEPLSDLAQRVRIRIWIRYLNLSSTQQDLLLNLARSYARRREQTQRQVEEITRQYESQITPVYERLHQALGQSAISEAELDALARELQGINLTWRRENDIHALRVRTIRSILAEQENFLTTLSPEQEDKLVSSLFFMRSQLDPLANPDTYRRAIGPTWNAGDFSVLLRQKGNSESNLNIGGLWGLEEDGQGKRNYSDIKRPFVLFFVLKEPSLVAALEENLAVARTGAPGNPAALPPFPQGAGGASPDPLEPPFQGRPGVPPPNLPGPPPGHDAQPEINPAGAPP